MRILEHFFFVGLLVAAAAVAAPETRDESVLFRWVLSEGAFELVTPSDIKPKSLYTRWDNGEQNYVWVTGDNRHMILSKSKVQGGRLGVHRDNAKNWFEYQEAPKKTWKKSTVRTRPEVWRWDPARVVGGSFASGIYRSEAAADGWESWGGDVDAAFDPPPVKPPPIDPPPVKPPPVDPPPVKPPPVDPPPVKPPPSNELACEITASPATAAVGETIILTMKTTGPVISATLDGAAVDFPTVLRGKKLEITGELPARLKVRGQVRAPNQGVAECFVEITVTAK